VIYLAGRTLLFEGKKLMVSDKYWTTQKQPPFSFAVFGLQT
jgi:hypothetical protein